jgi:hypothetical protein
MSDTRECVSGPAAVFRKLIAHGYFAHKDNMHAP